MEQMQVVEDERYRLLVRIGKDKVVQADKDAWWWGDAGIELLEASGAAAPDQYHDGSLAIIHKFAADTGNLYNTIQERVKVARVFPAASRVASFQVHKTLQGADVRHLIVPGMTWTEADSAKRRFKGAAASPTPDTGDGSVVVYTEDEPEFIGEPAEAGDTPMDDDFLPQSPDNEVPDLATLKMRAADLQRTLLREIDKLVDLHETYWSVYHDDILDVVHFSLTEIGEYINKQKEAYL